MPPARKPPRLRLKHRAGRKPAWIIQDGSERISTGCGERDLAGAERALQRYIASKFEPSKSGCAAALTIAEIITYYVRAHVMPNVMRKDVILYRAKYLLVWWGEKRVSDIKRSTLQEYLQWRVAQENVIVRRDGTSRISRVDLSTARKDLETLRTAVRFYHAEYPLDALPVFTLPAKAEPREEWLTRDQVAALLRAALRTNNRHLARYILIGVYSGTRTTAILGLQWMPSASGGWFDLENGVLYRRGRNAKQTKKRQTPARIHDRLLPHLRRWRAMDMQHGITHVINYLGGPVNKLRRSWDNVRDRAKVAAGINFHFTRHTLRHTAATWQVQSGVPFWEAASYLGMSAETLERVYGHHSPDFHVNASKAIPKRKNKA
jgi:integrase